MNKFLAFSLFTLTFSLTAPQARALPSYWAAVETTAYSGDKSGGTATSDYSMYYCTAVAAEDLFGGASVSEIESYLQGHFATARGMATTYDSVAFSDGEYQLLDYVDTAFTMSDYVAIAFYGNEAYRVYGLASAVLTPYGQLAFNESYAAPDAVGSWRQASVPEPTSALLLLLGVAGLALRRKTGGQAV